MTRWLLVGLLVAACAPATAQQIQKWTDANGRVHYGERPPPGQQTEAVQRGTFSSAGPDAPAGTAGSAKSTSVSDPEREFQERHRARLERDAATERAQANARAAEARAREAEVRRQAELDRRAAEQGAARRQMERFSKRY